MDIVDDDGGRVSFAEAPLVDGTGGALAVLDIGDGFEDVSGLLAAMDCMRLGVSQPCKQWGPLRTLINSCISPP